MKTNFPLILALSLVNASSGETITVLAEANPWLAGMPNGATARRGDSSPEQSPVAVTATPIEGGATYSFSASGSVNHGPTLPFSGPDGEENLIGHYLGAENGIADLTAPFVSLVGVFLGPGPPDQTPAPAALDFRNPADRDYLVLAPRLKQPFFIGDGLTSSGTLARAPGPLAHARGSAALTGSGAVQQVIAPIGATRLFLGVMDEYAWADNGGEFSVQVVQTASRPKVRLTLHPAFNPTREDAVANMAQVIVTPSSKDHKTTRPQDYRTTDSTTPSTSPATVPGPTLYAYTAIELTWASEPNRGYQVQWTASLQTPEWVNLGRIVSGTGTNLSVFDSTRARPQGFYRVRMME